MSTALAAAAAIDIDPILAGLRFAQKALADAAKYGLVLAQTLTPNFDGDDRMAAVLGQTADYCGTILANEKLIAFIRLVVGDPEVISSKDAARTARVAALVSTNEAAVNAGLTPDQWALIVRLVLSFLGVRK